MRLKQVRLYGFKSFADRTEISLDGQFTAVVGSNGCGKSNIVDAILWALGETSIKKLRASSSTDVIFSGSANRKPLGYAEVMLTFDNENGDLPLPTSEVTISRKIDRSGESTYSINGRVCRQKDIYELFADSGLGRTGYAVVSQSDIDAALSAPPEERRTWIDEAAGVQRYRNRKIESLKRLDSAIQHLQRVNDVIAELDIQREPLKEEAEAARIYKTKMASLREIESGLLILETAKLAEDINNLELSISERRLTAEKLREDADRLENKADEIYRNSEEIEGSNEKLYQELQILIAKKERAESRKALAMQRLASLDEWETNKESEEYENTVRIERAKSAVETAKREATEAKNAVELLLQVISGSDAEAQKMQQKLSEAEEKLAKARSHEIAEIHKKAKFESAKDILENLSNEIHQGIKDLDKINELLEETTKKHDEIASSTKENRKKLIEIGTAKKIKEDELSQLYSQVRVLLSESASIEGRIEALTAMLEEGDGLSSGTKAVLDAVSKGELQGTFIPVSSILEIPNHLLNSIESALGISASSLITNRSSEAIKAIEFIRDNKLGKATFLPLDTLRSFDTDAARNESNPPAVLGVASKLISFDSKYQKAVDLLLGNVLIVQNIGVAKDITKNQNWKKIVTLEGEVVFSEGVISGGRHSSGSGGIISRKSELKELEVKHAELSSAIQKYNTNIKEIENEISDIHNDFANIQSKLDEENDLILEITKKLASLNEQKLALERSIKRMQEEADELNKQISGNLQNQEDDNLSVHELEQQRNELLALSAAKTADAQQARRALEETKQRERIANERLTQAETELEEAISVHQNKKNRLTNLESEKQQHFLSLKTAEEELQKVISEISDIELKIEQAKKLRAELQQQYSKCLENAKQSRESARSLEDTAYREDIQRARAETKRANVLSRLLEEYNTSEEEAMQQAHLVDIPEDSLKIANELRREIKALGEVNLGAIEAFERLSERYDTLVTEREDILAAKAELDESIAELDRLTRGAFKETFEKVNEYFGIYFKRLFDGGRAELILTKPDSLLESGVDIQVEVPGKKTQRLELLSGGERALSACAFLFALFKVKPSPVCVLDELDAPLDGRNVERYVELLKEFSQREQFIVITHNPTTIYEAPLWLGVTIQEPGVSMVIPLRAPDEAVLHGQQSGNGRYASIEAV